MMLSLVSKNHKYVLTHQWKLDGNRNYTHWIGFYAKLRNEVEMKV